MIEIKLSVKGTSYTACYHPPTEKTVLDQERPARVDIWRGVMWVAQHVWVPETGIGDVRRRGVVWVAQHVWVPETGIGDVRHRPKWTRELDGEVLGRIADELRKRGV